MNEFLKIGPQPLREIKDRTQGDRVIWALVLLLALVSLLVVYSATGLLAYKKNKGNTEEYLFRQFGVIAVGLCVIYFSHQVNYTIYSRVAKILFLLCIPLLIYTLFFGVRLNEGSRWIRLPIINLTFQTSDLAKLALFMYLSRLLSKKQQVIKDFKAGFLPAVLPIAIICVLIAPANLSTALLTAATGMMLLFIGRVRIAHLLKTIGLASLPVVFLVVVAVSYYDTKESRGRDLPEWAEIGRMPTWIKRIQQFIYPQKELNRDENYQINQAKIAIAQGGILGRGPGNSEQRNFLPHPYSDFIYAIIIEEYGMIGGALIVFLYLLLLFRSIRIFRQCPYAFGAFLALGLSFTLVIQALVNMAVAVNLFPVTGVTLPLVSMGGSSFLFTCLSIGIILSVARNQERQEMKTEQEKKQDETQVPELIPAT